MRFVPLLLMTAALASTATAASLAGVWRLVEVNAVPGEDTPPRGQLNRKEIYTADGQLLCGRPDAPASDAQPMGKYTERDGVRLFTAPDGQQTATAIQWLDDDHFFLEHTPGECWHYARVKGPAAADQQWEPRSVVVVRTGPPGTGPTLREFNYDLTDDSAMPWEKRIVGAWETIKVAGRAVSGPDMPPYGMPNDRFLITAKGTMQKVKANGQTDRDSEIVPVEVKSNKITVAGTDFSFYFWFNRWGQLVFEQEGLQTVLKRISLDPAKAPAGPFVVVLLGTEREEPPREGKIVEVKKSAAPAAAAPVASAKTAGRATAAGRPKATFTQPYNGGSFARDLALAEDDASFKAKHPAYAKAAKDGLGKPAPVVEVDTDDKFAVVKSAALGATLEVPLGWHATDDGKRTVVFDTDRFVQAELEVRAAKQGAKALLQKMLDDQKARQPSLRAQLLDNGDGSAVLMLPNYELGGEVVSRALVAREGKTPGELFVAQITSGPGDFIRGLNLSEALFRHVKPQG